MAQIGALVPVKLMIPMGPENFPTVHVRITDNFTDFRRQVLEAVNGTVVGRSVVNVEIRDLAIYFAKGNERFIILTSTDLRVARLKCTKTAHFEVYCAIQPPTAELEEANDMQERMDLFTAQQQRLETEVNVLNQRQQGIKYQEIKLKLEPD